MIGFYLSTCFLIPILIRIFRFICLALIQFCFVPSARRLTNAAFEIDPESGLISLARSVFGGADTYSLNITAYDDGSCCRYGGRQLSKHCSVTVHVIDINTYKPTFDTCASYSDVGVKEHTGIGQVVMQVCSFS